MVEIQNCSSALEDSLSDSYKTKPSLTIWPNNYTPTFNWFEELTT